jgi:hypothetical protein
MFLVPPTDGTNTSNRYRTSWQRTCRPLETPWHYLHALLAQDFQLLFATAVTSRNNWRIGSGVSAGFAPRVPSGHCRHCVTTQSSYQCYQLLQLTHLRSWALLEKPPIVQLLKNFQHFMEPDGSLPSSQEPSTGPYPEPDQFNPYHPILSMIHFNSVHPPTSWSSYWSLSFWLSQYPICIPLLPHSCYMPCPSTTADFHS